MTTYVLSGLTNVGQIMGEFNKHYKGLADNKVVSMVVKEILENTDKVLSN